MYKKTEKYDSPSGFMITYKVDEKLFNEKMKSYINYFDIKKPIKVGNSDITSLILRNYSYDSYFVRNGKVTLTTLIDQHAKDYDYWEGIYKNKEDYKKDKERIAEEVKTAIAKHYDISVNELETIDTFSPATLNRYTGAYKGSYMCFELNHKNHMMMHNGKFKGLKNFFFAGQWAQMPGGLPPTLIVSKFTIQRIMKKEKHSFSHIHTLFMKTFRKSS
jgi:phytoene dehydrogenase-like protein